jgi:hypothetical protein
VFVGRTTTPCSPRACLLVFAFVGGCVDARPQDHPAPAPAPHDPEARDRDEAEAAAPAPVAPPVAPDGPPRDLLSIPPGTVHAGSLPGTPGRTPSAEMDDTPFELHEFEIERGVRPQTGLGREQAAAICASEERRLCTELEWEWACEGEEHLDVAKHRSPFGVIGMSEQREWTASAWGTTEADRALGYAIRGVRPDTPSSARRCAARAPSLPPPPEEGEPAVDPATSDVAFRCCAGEANAAAVTPEPPRGTFFPITLTPERFAAVVKSIPELGAVHDAPRAFGPREAEAAALRPGPGQPSQGWQFGPGPLLWTPERGDQILVLAGRNAKHSFVAALYRLPGDRFRHAASMLVRDDVTAITLAWGALRREIIWTPCWNCGETEGGKIVYRLETLDLRVTHQ